MPRLSFAVVLPAIDPCMAHQCVQSMHAEMRRHTLLIDNEGLGRIGHNHRVQVGEVLYPVANLGVPVSWNEGIDYARAIEAEYLLIVSQSITFGLHGGVDFLAHLESRRPQVLMHSQHGWKFLAINTQVFDLVGMFDPIFSPAYYEEQDWMWRLHLAGFPSPRANDGQFDQVDINATSAGDAMTLKKGLVHVDLTENAATFRRKWGGDEGPERWDLWPHPYADPTLDCTFIGPYPPPSVVDHPARTAKKSK